jgi:hypothetical protein
VSASLSLLTKSQILNPRIEEFVMACYEEQRMNFRKHYAVVKGDPVHTFHSVLGLEILKNGEKNVSAAQMLGWKVVEDLGVKE